MELELQYGESRGYWKYHAPGKWFRQAKAIGKINNERATLLFNSGAEVSIVDSTFARKVGCTIDESQRQECVGIGENAYMTEGRTKIKVTLAGSLVYFFHAWAGTLSGQDAILGMDFMVPAGIRLDLAEGTLCLPDEVRIQLSGRRPLYNGKVIPISVDRSLAILAGRSEEIPIRSGLIERQTLWVTRGKHWVPTVVRGLGRRQYMRISNLGETTLYLGPRDRIGMWLPGDTIPRLEGYVTVGSRRYTEWQSLAFQATTDLPEDGSGEEPTQPMVDRPQYATPTRILTRSKENHRPVISQVVASTPPALVPNEGTLEVESNGTVEGPSPVETEEEPEAEEPIRDLPSDDASPIKAAVQDHTETTPAETPMKSEPPEIEPSEPPQEEPVCYHEGGELFAEDVESHMAVLPEVATTTEEVTIEDIQVGNPADNSPEEIERLRQIIWKRCHLLMGKGNALPPAARGESATSMLEALLRWPNAVGESLPSFERSCPI